MKTFFCLLAVMLLMQSVNAQQKVANYSTGKPGTEQYEHFSFWVKDGKPSEISYTYGKDKKETMLKREVTSGSKGKQTFTVKFPNNHVLMITPTGYQLRVKDAKGKYNKTFRWEYEGPVNGVGTYCDVCAQDEKEAMSLIKTYYLK